MANKRYAYFNLRTINRQEHRLSKSVVGGSIPSWGAKGRYNSLAISVGSSPTSPAIFGRDNHLVISEGLSPSSTANCGQGICLAGPRIRSPLDHQFTVATEYESLMKHVSSQTSSGQNFVKQLQKVL